MTKMKNRKILKMLLTNNLPGCYTVNEIGAGKLRNKT